MKSTALPSLRGKIGSNNRIRIEVTKAINSGATYAKRSTDGYSAAAEALEDFLEEAIAQNLQYTRADSIAVTPATVTLAAGASQPITVVATWGSTERTVMAPATATITFADVPANNGTVTIGSRVYTFKTTLTGAANEVLIGANVTASATNLRSALNGQTGAGSLYGTGTVAHADVGGSNAAGVLTVFTRRHMETAPSLAKSGTNPTLSAAALSGGVLDARVAVVSDTPADATVNSSGVATWASSGSATITATFQGRTDTLVVTAS